jgi:hypothetical protein
MRALGFLLGARAIDLAPQRSERRRVPTDGALPPIAETVAQLRAWRRWAAAGRASAAAASAAPASAAPAWPMPTNRAPRTVPGGGGA